MEWLKTSLLLAVYKTVPILELSPPLWTAIGWVQRGPTPPTPVLRVLLKWAKSPRSSGVPSLSLGADMGSKGGLAERAGRGLRSAEGGPDSPLSPAPLEHVCY